MSLSFLISIIVIIFVTIISIYTSKYMLLCVIAYCIYEQISFRIKRGTIHGPIFIPPIVGYIYESMNPKMREYAELWKKGTLVATSVLGKFIIVCNSSESVKQILTDNTGDIELCLVNSMKKIISPDNFVFTMGQVHKDQRMNFISFLSKKNMGKYIDLQLNKFNEIISMWVINFSQNTYHHHFRKINLYSFFNIFFGSYLDTMYYRTVSENLEIITKSLQLVNFPLNMPGTNVWNAINAREEIVKIFEETIEISRKNPNNNLCLLNEFNNSLQKIVDEKKPPLLNCDTELLKDTNKLALAIFSFIFASQDALTSAVSWTIAQLANNMDVQETLFKEINKNSDMQKSIYLESFVKEVLRFRCPVIMVPHITTNSYKLEDHIIPKNTIVIPSIWASAHDKKFKTPDIFNPERFMDPNQIFNNSYIFGTGQHACLGMYYTIQHLTVLIIAILKKYKISSDGIIDVNDVQIFSTSYPNKNIKFRFTKRI